MKYMDYYEVLNITPNATESEIKKAYRSLSFQYHPDKNPDPSASDKIKSINEAYETLGDSQKKKQYDNRNNPMNMDSIIKEMFRNDIRKHQPPNIFEELFKMNSGMMGEPIVFTSSFDNIHGMHMNSMNNMNSMNEQNITPLDKKIEIPFEQSFTGGNIPINIEREFRKGNTFFKEQEKIYVNIPSGIDDGEIIEIPDKGNIMFDRKGSLRLHIKIIQHSRFERRGLNLIYSQTITFKESLCGFEYLLNFIDGSPLRLKSSRGNIIQNGDDKSVKGKGFTRDGQVGDLVIRFKVTPQELSEEQILLFEKEL